MSRNAISANPVHYFFEIFQGSIPPDPPSRPKKIFPTLAARKNFFRVDSPPPKQKILDGTLSPNIKGMLSFLNALVLTSHSYFLPYRPTGGIFFSKGLLVSWKSNKTKSFCLPPVTENNNIYSRCPNTVRSAFKKPIIRNF